VSQTDSWRPALSLPKEPLITTSLGQHVDWITAAQLFQHQCAPPPPTWVRQLARMSVESMPEALDDVLMCSPMSLS